VSTIEPRVRVGLIGRVFLRRGGLFKPYMYAAPFEIFRSIGKDPVDCSSCDKEHVCVQRMPASLPSL
jgi:hypothetical protein